MNLIKGLMNRRRASEPDQDMEILHVADPPVSDQYYGVPRCRRRSLPAREALREAAQLLDHCRGDGVAIVVMRKDGGADYWLAGRALTDPVRASGVVARLLDLANRLPAYLSDPFPD